MSVDEPTERERELVQVLREARDQMVELKSVVDDEVRWVAIGEAIEFAILSVDMRIAEIKRTVMRGSIGTTQDFSRHLAGHAIEETFEAVLKVHGFQVVPLDAEPVA